MACAACSSVSDDSDVGVGSGSTTPARRRILLFGLVAVVIIVGLVQVEDGRSRPR